MLKLSTIEGRKQIEHSIEPLGVNDLDIVELTNKLESRKTTGPSENLRHKGEYFMEPVAKLAARDKFFVNRVVTSWNRLPEEIRKAKSLNCFKAGLYRLKEFSS